MTWLKAVNVFVFQWFFVRLTRCKQRVPKDIHYHGHIDRKDINKHMISIQWYSIHYWVMPCTGWWGNHIYLNRGKYFKISKSKII